MYFSFWNMWIHIHENRFCIVRSRTGRLIDKNIALLSHNLITHHAADFQWRIWIEQPWLWSENKKQLKRRRWALKCSSASADTKSTGSTAMQRLRIHCKLSELIWTHYQRKNIFPGIKLVLCLLCDVSPPSHEGCQHFLLQGNRFIWRNPEKQIVNSLTFSNNYLSIGYLEIFSEIRSSFFWPNMMAW